MSFPRAVGPRVAYNANGLRSLSLPDAVRLLADTGYDGIELSLNEQHVDPWKFGPADAEALRDELAATGVQACSLATGDPHLLGPTPFEPGLVDEDPEQRRRRLDLIAAGIRIGVAVGVPLVVFSTGRRHDAVSPAAADRWLDDAVRELLDVLADELARAGRPPSSTVLGIEPEPGFHCQSNADVAAVLDRHRSPDLWLSQDLGHTVVVDDDPLTELERHLPSTRHLQVEDIAGRAHRHLVPGDGDVDFDAVARCLWSNRYDGWVSVELYDHDAVHESATARSLRALRECFSRADGSRPAEIDLRDDARLPL